MSELIRLEHVSFSYEDDNEVIPALRDISLTINRGEYVAVLGHNGSGKSTLAKMLNMILTPDSGTIYIDGRRITTEDPDKEPDADTVFAVRQRIGMVFQNPDNQLVATTVEEDVAFGGENLGVPREELRCRVDNALAQVDMTDYALHAPGHLSGGQKQRVAIAGIIVMEPACIVLDEATAMLDPLGRQEVLQTVERLNKEKDMAVLHITHYMDEAARADRVIVINDGSLLMDGTPEEVFAQTEILHKVGLEAPQGMELLAALRACGVEVRMGGVSEEACVDELEKVISARG